MGVRVINPVQQTVPPMMIPQRAQPNFEMYGPMGAGIASAGESIGQGLIAGIQDRARREMFGQELEFQREKLREESGLERERIGTEQERTAAEERIQSGHDVSNEAVARLQQEGMLGSARLTKEGAIETARMSAEALVKQAEINKAASIESTKLTTEGQIKQAVIDAAERRSTAWKQMATSIIVTGMSSGLKAMTDLAENRRLTAKDKLDSEAAMTGNLAELLGKGAEEEGARNRDVFSAKQSYITGEKMSFDSWNRQIEDQMDALNLPGAFAGGASISPIWAGGMSGWMSSDLNPITKGAVQDIVAGIESSGLHPDIQLALKARVVSKMTSAASKAVGSSTMLTDNEEAERYKNMIDRVLEPLGVSRKAFSVDWNKLGNDWAAANLPSSGTEREAWNTFSKFAKDVSTAYGTKLGIKVGRLPPEADTPDQQALRLKGGKVLDKLLQNPKPETILPEISGMQQSTVNIGSARQVGQSTATVAQPVPSQPAWEGNPLFRDPERTPWDSSRGLFLETPRESGVWETSR